MIPSADLDVNLDQFFEMSLDHLTVAGFDGYFKRLNAAWTKTFGWTTEEFLSTPSVDFVHPDDRAATLAARHRLTDGVPLSGLVNRYRCKDGSYRFLEWKSTAYLDRRLVYAVARDVTQERQAAADKERIEQQLVLAERMATIGRLAAGVAHEINNPLTTVMGNLGLAIEDLRAERGLSPRMQELEGLLSDAMAGTERVKKIVLGLKTFARAGVERRARIRIRPVLEVSLNLIASDLRRRAQLVEEYGETPEVEADEARLGEVMMNLLSNAAQAIAPGQAASQEIRLRTATDAAGRAVIEIQDTGVGIPPAFVGRIFDPFFTTRPIGQGTGLGLSVCHNLVAAMGGEITVASEEGRGSTFRVVLPAAR